MSSTEATPLKAPFPYFGGKSRAAAEVWRRFGTVTNFCEPFFGSGAVLLLRPDFDYEKPQTETVNDLNGWLANFWRALQRDPDAVAYHADYPVSELDLHARGDWLFYRRGVDEWVEQVRSDPEFYDVKSAGWWVWGLCCWIGSGWGPMMRAEGKARQLPHLGDAGQGVNRKLPHLGNAGQALRDYLNQLADRMRKVRVCCGDWTRILGPSVTFKHGMTGVFLDPPYGATDRHDCYDSHNDYGVAADVREWCKANGANPLLRIALCGYSGEGHEELESLGWRVWKWRPRGGFDGQNKDRDNNNRDRERIWFSPACMAAEKHGLVQKELL